MTNTDKTVSTATRLTKPRAEMSRPELYEMIDQLQDDLFRMALASRTQSPAEWHKRLRMTRKALERAEKFAADYEFDSDEGFHVPSDLERMLMLDMLNGLFDDEEFIAALDATPPAPERSKEEVGVKVREAVRQYLDQQSAAHADGHLEHGSYFSTLDNLPDFVASTLEPASLHKGEAVAWEGYWPGAGSISSATKLTKDKNTAARWQDDGAEITPLYASSAPLPVTFQDRVAEAHVALFHDDPTDLPERRDRFYEEATEAAQALGMTEDEAHQLVSYTFSRPPGDVRKEIGAAALTLASVCVVGGWDMMACAEADLAALRTPEKIAKVRAKRATRHGRGPLPGHGPAALSKPGEQ